jgi:hypothetical protein
VGDRGSDEGGYVGDYSYRLTALARERERRLEELGASRTRVSSRVTWRYI